MNLAYYLVHGGLKGRKFVPKKFSDKDVLSVSEEPFSSGSQKKRYVYEYNSVPYQVLEFLDIVKEGGRAVMSVGFEKKLKGAGASKLDLAEHLEDLELSDALERMGIKQEESETEQGE